MPYAAFALVTMIEDDAFQAWDPADFVCYPIDDAYLDGWWDRLVLLQTYAHQRSRAYHGLARWGITLIPPQSLPQLQDIVLCEPRLPQDAQLIALASLIQQAINAQCYLIHFGV